MSPLTLPTPDVFGNADDPQEVPKKKARNPFDGLDPASTSRAANPFNGLDPETNTEKLRHADILRRNEEGRQNDIPPTIAGEIAAGAKDVYAAVRHPLETIKGMGKAAAHDINLAMSERIPQPGEMGAVPSDLTPEQQHELPKAIVNTALLAATPILPTGSLLTRGAVNAGLGALNAPDQPLRGATAGLILGETLHQAPGLVPERVVSPRVRLGETSEALKGGEFRRTLGVDDVAAATAPVVAADRPVVEPLSGVERLAPAKPPATTPRPPKGLASNPFDGLDPALGKQQPLPTQSPADVFAARAEAMNDPMRPRRRPAAEVPPPSDSPAPAPVPDAVAAPSAPAQAEPLPSYPEGFAMGGPEGRIPRKGELPKLARGAEPEPVKGLEPNAPPPDPWADWVDHEPAPADVTQDTTAAAPIVKRAPSIDLEAQQEAARVPRPASIATADPYEIPLNRAPVEGTGPTKTRGLSASVERSAIEHRLTEGLGELPQYQQLSMADQAAKATELLGADLERAHRIARGEEPAPHGLLPESVFVAVENKALAEGDVATLRDLATGKLTAQATEMGQRIRTLGERDPESPVAAMQSVLKAREEGAGNIAQKSASMVSDAESHIAKVQITPSTWSAFIDSIRC